MVGKDSERQHRIDDGHADERASPPWERAWATMGLIAVNVSVFLAMVLAGASPLFTAPGDAIAAGGIDPGRVWTGEVWRLLTACFVHLGVWHLALNMWVLHQLGRALERMVGSARFVLVYVASGVFGFALSVATTAKPTAGASGAVFGVTGALLALAVLLRHKDLGKLIVDALLPFIIATFVLGLLVPMVDNSAHVGGLVFGFLLCFGLSAGDRRFLQDDTAPPRTRRTEQVMGGAALVCSALLLVSAGAYAARPIWSPLYLAQTGLTSIQAGDIDSAEERARALTRIAPDGGATFLLRARLTDVGASTPEAHIEAVRLAREALQRYGDDAPDAFRDAHIELALIGGGTEELPFHDHRTVNLLCDAVVGMMPAPDAAADDAFDRAEVRNECAWLKIRSGDEHVHDLNAGLALAQQAVFESGGKVANHVHTLADALAQHGDGEEALALLEKLAAEGRAAELPGGSAFLDGERRRVRQLLDEQRMLRTRVSPTPAPGGSSATSMDNDGAPASAVEMPPDDTVSERKASTAETEGRTPTGEPR